MEAALKIASEYRNAGERTAVIICGPTASGKSSLAMELCSLVGGEIVSCDSMQIYRMMDIGTAKPSLAEMEQVPHHMIDVIDPWENYNAFLYKRDAERCIGDILGRVKVPVICGGTGLYVNSLVDNRLYTDEPEGTFYSEAFKEEKEKCDGYFSSGDKEALYSLLLKYDPDAAAEIHKNNVKRVYRALCLYFITGKDRMTRDRESLVSAPDVNYLIYCIQPERDELYRRINERVDLMREKGLFTEAAKVYEACRNNVPAESVESLDILKLTALSAIGYKELIPFLDFPELSSLRSESEPLDIDLAFEKIKQDTRRYAKRQITWFKKTPGVVFI